MPEFLINSLVEARPSVRIQFVKIALPLNRLEYFDKFWMQTHIDDEIVKCQISL